jgi:hypothetical protein
MNSLTKHIFFLPMLLPKTHGNQFPGYRKTKPAEAGSDGLSNLLQQVWGVFSLGIDPQKKDGQNWPHN